MDVGPGELGRTIESFGYAVVFLFLYTATTWFLIRLLYGQLKERKEETARMTSVIEQNTTAMRDLSSAIREVKASQAACTKQASDLMIYVRTREERRK